MPDQRIDQLSRQGVGAASRSTDKARRVQTQLVMNAGRAVALLIVLFGLATPAGAYSVLTHEAAIDVSWDPAIKPLLVRRFPRTSPDELVRARSFAYGGSVIQDLGYYPF